MLQDIEPRELLSVLNVNDMKISRSATVERSETLDICLKQGKLTKLGGQVKKWKNRFCKLEGNFLKYFRLNDGVQGDLLGRLLLSEATVTNIASSVYNKQFLFGVTPYGRKRTYVFGAKNEEELGEWTRLLFHTAESKRSSVVQSVTVAAEEEKKKNEDKNEDENEDKNEDSIKMIRKSSGNPGKGFQYSESDSEKVSEDLSLDSESSSEEAVRYRKSIFIPQSTRTNTSPNQAVVKEGFLIKLGHNRKNWLRRFFRLNGHLLCYYEDHQCTDKLGEIHLLGAVLRLHDEKEYGKRFVFSITQYTGDKRQYFCEGASQEDFDAWKEVIMARHKCENKPIALKISLKEHPDIAMKMNPNDKDLKDITVHGLQVTNIASRKSGSSIKSKVSKKKRRFFSDGYNLDLTYVTDRIIAMGFPSVGTESIYRNGMVDVQRFFNERHESHFKIYNLCSERKYEPECFDGRVLHFPFDDHNCPCFQDLSFLCRELAAFLAKDPKNIAGIHCKAGKGRTGLIITAFLLYCGEWATADEALRYYAFARTENQKGVTIPSQIRWVHYYERYMKCSIDGGTGLPPPERLIITKMVFSKKCPSFNFFKFECHGQQVNSRNLELKFTTNKDTGDMEVAMGAPFIALTDFQMQFMKKKAMKSPSRAMSFWLHTQFIDNYHVQLRKKDIDKVSKDKGAADFTVDIYFKADQNQEGLDTFPF